MEKLLDSIIRYLDYLNNDLQLSVSVHFCDDLLKKLPKRWFMRLCRYNSHNNHYCLNVKGLQGNGYRCICEQKSIYENYREDSFFRICYAGVYEYIAPVCENRKIVSFVAVSGFRREAPDGINKTLWERYLKKGKFPQKLADTLVPPLVVMLRQLFGYCNNSVQSEENAILQYLNEYHTNISLDDLCRHFSRSRSYISHMFRKTYNMTFKEYVNELKLSDAHKLILNTDMSVTEVAYESGFGDVSYFIGCFKKRFGVSPLKYRKKSR